jgi:hypothetical protein
MMRKKGKMVFMGRGILSFLMDGEIEKLAKVSRNGL